MNDAVFVDTPDFFPVNSPFSDTQRSFLNGLFLGRLNRSASGGIGDSNVDLPQSPVTILFASQTGTAEALSKNTRKLAAQHGFTGSVADLDSVELTDLDATTHLLIIAATSGEGDPPDNAQSFHRSLMADDAPRLPSTLNFSVCGLGDSSYAHFNKVAREIDDRLGELGATRAAPLVPCDADYDDEFEAWRKAVFSSPQFEAAAGAAVDAQSDDDAHDAEFYSKKRPFLATLLDCQCLSEPGSAKKVNHIELSLASGCDQLTFEVGDALGLWPLNGMDDVNAVLQLTNTSPRAIVQTKNGPMPLQQALQCVFDLTTVSKTARELWQICATQEELPEEQLIDVLAQNHPPLTPQTLVDGLRLLQPRLYSISSSPNKHPGEVHLTVSEVHYEVQGSPRKGVASTFLGERLAPGSTLGVYVQKSSHFGLPDNDETPLIMIGPGTGIAPFRSFLEEREVRGAKGKNWLFFGDQHKDADYLYKQQICSWRSSGLLNRVSLAWSRDTAEKVYVQHLIRQESEAFYRWLKQGAAIYVCGDASRMAADVEAAILDVISEQGGMSAPDAQDYLDDLRRSHRYQRDVY